MASAPDSKSGGWGFESLQACWSGGKGKGMNKISQYLSDVRQEVSKVSWPTREELYGSTTVVLVFCLILSLFVFGVDFLLNRLLEILF